MKSKKQTEAALTEAALKHGDDRNLIDLTEQADALRLEERLLLILETNKKAILSFFAVCFALIIGWQGYGLWEVKAQGDFQEKYNEALKSMESLERFGKAHPTQSLGAVANLLIADQYYRNGDYKTAQARYAAVQVHLKAPIKARAELGIAICKIRLKDTEGALRSLEQLARKPEASDALRAQAAYEAAKIKLSEDKGTEAIYWLELIFQLPYAGEQWRNRARRLAIAEKDKLTPPSPETNPESSPPPESNSSPLPEN